MVTALNKVDLLPDRAALVDAIDSFDLAIPVSGWSGEGLPLLLRTIEGELDRTLVTVDARIAYAQGGMVARIYDAGVVDKIDHEEHSIHVRARVPRDLAQEINRLALKRRRRSQPTSMQPDSTRG
jgi:50S ribosomal subunit-associated GTPase HflX